MRYVDNNSRCKRCVHADLYTRSCDYILHTGHPRGCSVQECDKFKPGGAGSRRVCLSEELRNAYKANYEKGLSDAEIAEVCGTSASSVRAWRSNAGLTSNVAAKRIEREQGFRRLYDEGMTDAAIAKQFGTYSDAVAKWRARNGLPSQRQKRIQQRIERQL